MGSSIAFGPINQYLPKNLNTNYAVTMLRRLVTTRKHSGSGGNNTFGRLVQQGAPYLLSPNGYAKFPMTVFFTINGRCNMRCRMCDIGEKNHESMFYHNLAGENGADFPISRFKTLMDEFEPHKPYISFSTTEPFLYKPLFEAIDYARFRGMNLNVTTNGLRVEKFIDEIFESGLHRLSISIDGPADLHNEMRRVPLAYERIMRGIRLVAERKRQLGTMFPLIALNGFVADTNQGRLLETIENLPLDDIDHVNFKLMVFHTQKMVDEHNAKYGDKYPATATCLPDDFDPNAIDANNLVHQAKEINERFGDKVFLHFESNVENIEKYFFSPEEFMDRTRCVLPWFVAQITNDGELAVYTRCYDLRFGNVIENKFEDVWNGEKMRDFRKNLRHHGRFPACARCDGVLYR